MISQFPRKQTFVLIASVLILSACGGGSDSKVKTQVAARVNKEEISVHQINAVLAKTPNVTPEQSKQLGQQVLEKLIDQQLLVEKALEKKLDRDPNTLQQLESAKREILARTYLEQLSSGVDKPGADEVREYYSKNPALFAERRLYNFNEVSMPRQDGLLEELQQQTSKFKSMSDLVDWLKQKNVQFTTATATKPAEQLPSELLPRLHKMKDGQMALMNAQGRIVVLQLAASRTAAVDEKTAAPVIEQYLGNQKKMDLVTREMKGMRGQAKIEYLGDFTPPASVEKAAEAKPETADKKAAAPVAGQTSAEAAVIEKGLSSIK